MKKKKGFTVVELLAVIMVLSIILVIAIPKLMSSVEKSKKKSFEISANKLIQEAAKEYSKDLLGKEYVITGGEFVGSKLKVTGELPEEGIVVVSGDGKIAIAVNNGKYCVKKELRDNELTIDTNIENCNVLVETAASCFTTNDVSTTEVEITDYDNNTCSTDVVIPSEINGKTVVKIRAQAFAPQGESSTYNNDMEEKLVHNKFDLNKKMIAYNNAKFTKEKESKYLALLVNEEKPITSVVIPDSVTSIGDSAFQDNQLTSVIIPNSVISVGNYAFYNNQLVNVTISDSMTVIGGFAFANNQLTNITIPDRITNIGHSAFRGNQLTSITIPNRVGNIGGYAFYDNQLTSITISDSVRSIGNAAFNNNQLPDSEAFIYARNSGDGSECKTVVASYGGAKRDNVIIPVGVTYIEGSAFAHNQLTSITIPNSVTIIGDYAFYDNQLTSITIPNSVTNIGNSAFYNNQLTNIIIPNSVTSIGSSAFENNQLTNITIPSSITSIEDYAFSYNQLTNVTIPTSVTSIGNYTFYNNQLTNIIIPNNVTSIGSSAFKYNQLTNVTIPSYISMGIDYNPISSTFYTAYVTNNSSQGGTYTAPSQNGTWTRQP